MNFPTETVLNPFLIGVKTYTMKVIFNVLVKCILYTPTLFSLTHIYIICYRQMCPCRGVFVLSDVFVAPFNPDNEDLL
jgi:hypothetical protein